MNMDSRSLNLKINDYEYGDACGYAKIKIVEGANMCGKFLF